jgi:hypothetical protein
MKIVLMVEGKTEVAFKDALRRFLEQHLQGKMPRLSMHKYDGRIPKGEKLRRVVWGHLGGKNPADAVIALTDVYTGTNPPDFVNAVDAKLKMKQWVGNEPRFYPHAAQHDFESWLLPFWATIQKLACHDRRPPVGPPEDVNHNKPPAHIIKELFEAGKCRDSYSKPRDAKRILAENDLTLSAAKCPELKALLNTILNICGAGAIQ